METRELILKENLIVTNIEKVKEMVERQYHMEFNESQVTEFLNQEVSTVFYLDDELKMVQEPQGSIAWVDTGYTDINGEPVFISLKNYGGIYEGYFVGTGRFLMNGMRNRNMKNGTKILSNWERFNKEYDSSICNRSIKHLDICVIREKVDMTSETESVREKSTEKREQQTSILDEIYNNLKYPTWKSKAGFDRYLKIIGHRLSELVRVGKNEYFIENTSRIGAVVNTGLIDNFGDDYYLYYKAHFDVNNVRTYKLDAIVTGKRFYHENGFEGERFVVKPISFFEGEDRCLKASLEQLDITNRNLNHILLERQDRFPEVWNNMSDSKKADYIKSALSAGLKIQARDSSYAKAIYSTESKGISWLLPLYVMNDFPQNPELVLVIRQVGGFYEVKTILPYDEEVMDRITAVYLYREMW